MEILYTPKFEREYKKLTTAVKISAEEKEEVFRRDAFDAKLKTHKLKGKMEGWWSFSVDYKYRIIFEFSKDKQTACFHSIGDHDIYQ